MRSLLQSGDYTLVGGYSPICKGTCIRLETKISHRPVSSCHRSVPSPPLPVFPDGEGRDTCTFLVRKAMINLCSRKWPICILVEPGILILISVALYGEPGFHHGRFAKYLVILIRNPHLGLNLCRPQQQRLCQVPKKGDLGS